MHLPETDSRPRRTFLIQDPYHEYAVSFIEHIFRRYGYRAVCFYTDRRERIRRMREFPILESECVAAAYDVRLTDLAGFAAHLAERHDVVAVVPFNEPSVLPAVELAQLLALDWAQSTAMRRVREKFTLKEFLRTHHPDIRINASVRVRTLRDVLSARRERTYQRFIVKPESGFGNRDIGLFDASTPEQELQAYLQHMQGAPLTMEEYVDGDEYFVNGQIDAAGRVHTAAVFQYLRRPANGRHNIDFETALVSTRDPRFAPIADYARQVLIASGLVRTPFHLELKLDDRGPCLIELGARLAGHGNVLLCNDLHRTVPGTSNGLDLIALAAHYYLSAQDYGPPPFDWSAYDSAAIRYVHGVATRRERIYRLRGVPEVEALATFYRWVKKPSIGMSVEPTKDSLSMPFSVVLKGPPQSELSAAASQVRALLRWNEPRSWIRRMIVDAGCLLERCRRLVRVRFASFLEPEHSDIRPIARLGLLSALWRHSRRLIAAVAESLSLRWQLLSDRWQPANLEVAAPTKATEPRREVVMRWAREYIARPDPRIGRSGPICPFMQPSLELQAFHVWEPPAAGPVDLRQLRRTALAAARTFSSRYPLSAPKGNFASVAVVYPQLTGQQAFMLDRLHAQLKAYLVINHDLMSTPFHPHSDKPSVSNPSFMVFRAPLPLLVLRHLDVRDIRFLDHNARAFKRYHARFADLYASGDVSDEFGYVQRFTAACKRFGILSGAHSA